MEITTLIVDDEHLAELRLTSLIKDIPELKLLGSAKTGKDAIEKINSLSPQLIFLDIKLKDMTGFDILDKIHPINKPYIVFVSAYDRFAIKAFDYEAFDYLLKPYKDERFITAVQKAVKHLKKDDLHTLKDNIETVLNTQPALQQHKKLSIKQGNKVLFIDISTIKYITASGYYIEVFTIDNKKFLLRESLTNIINRLNNNSFTRIHRSTVMNIEYISELIHSSFGEIDVKTKDKKLFRVSKSYKQDFLTLIGI